MFRQDFTSRQYMVTPDFEFFHYKDRSTLEVEYHNHDFNEVFFLLAGKVTYVIEGKSHRLKPGDIVLINNKELHRPIIELGEWYERMVLWINPGFLADQSAEDCSLSLCFDSSSPDRHRLLRPQSEMAASIKNTLLKFEKACSGSGYGNNLLKKIHLTELLVLINRAFLETRMEDAGIDIEYNEKVSSIIRYINGNLDDDLSLDLLSSKFYISKYHLLREFKKHAGYTIHRYIQQKRLIMAKSLLKDGMPVTEVYARCGFGDYSNFIRSFKRAFGLSPKKYCQMHT